MIPFIKYKLTIASAFALMLITACSNEEMLADTSSASTSDGVYATMPQLVNVNVSNGPQSRSTLHYDHTSNTMKFNWTADDAIGVFGYQSDAALHKFTRTPNQQASTEAEVQNQFTPPSGVGTIIAANNQYISYRPFNIVPENYNYINIPVSFAEQTAAGNVKMAKYYTEAYGDYTDSEKTASSHLSNYDYLVSAPTTANANGGITFDMKRLVVVTRFFLKCPAEETFESIQLVVNGPNKFIINGVMNMEAGTITTAENGTSTTQTLKLGANGLDMSTPTANDNYYGGIGYIVAYMMLAPIDLTTATSLNIYLISKDGENYKYYRARSVNKPNLTANMFYQWTSANNDLAPITFEPVTVQQWEEDTHTNDKGGTGAW